MLILIQIEQFIESLYPTQDPKALAELRATQTGTEKPPIDKVKAQQAKQDTSRACPFKPHNASTDGSLQFTYSLLSLEVFSS